MKTARLHKYYNNIVTEDLLILYNYNNIMQLPVISQVICSTSSKSYLLEKKDIIKAYAASLLLAGQKPVLTRALKSVAAFKLRKGSLIGCKVTMRKKRMYELLDKLILFLLPRLQKQKLTTKDIDNIRRKQEKVYNVGINNPLLWPEVEFLIELFDFIKGFNLSFSILRGSPLKRQEGVNFGVYKSQVVSQSLFLSAFQYPCR